MEVQTVIFSKEKFKTREDALKWAKAHGYKTYTSRETANSWRIRQRSPEDFKDDFVTKETAPGVSILLGTLRKDTK